MNDIKEELLPTLFHKASNGKIKEWRCKVVAETDQKTSHCLVSLKTEQGFLGGKLSSTSKLIEKGKNIGKANQTSPWQQAISEGKSRWNKKKDREGWSQNMPSPTCTKMVTNYSAEEQVVTSLIDKNKIDAELLLKPMLAVEYTDRQHDMSWPCYAQPKLDGVRCLARADSTLFSRQGVKFSHLNHIREEVARLISKKEYLDGELYTDDLTFEEIVGLCKQETVKDPLKLLQIKYHVFDYYDFDSADLPFEERFAILKKRFSMGDYRYLQLVETVQLQNETFVTMAHQQFVEKGYEGLILRNKNSLYKAGYRSKDLQKFKSFNSEEFKIIGFKEATGNDAGTVIWQCQTKEGPTFFVRPKSTREQKRDWFNNGKKYLGKMLTVNFQGYTNGRVPRFPRGVIIRNYE